MELEKLEAHLMIKYPLTDVGLKMTEGDLELVYVGVKAQFRKMGYGTALLCDLKRFCADNRIPRIQVFSVYDAIKFYEKCGFVRPDKHTGFLTYTIRRGD